MAYDVVTHKRRYCSGRHGWLCCCTLTPPPPLLPRGDPDDDNDEADVLLITAARWRTVVYSHWHSHFLYDFNGISAAFCLVLNVVLTSFHTRGMLVNYTAPTGPVSSPYQSHDVAKYNTHL